MALAGDELEVHTVAGDNNSLFDVRFVDALAEKLKHHRDARAQAGIAVKPEARAHNELCRQLKLARISGI